MNKLAPGAKTVAMLIADYQAMLQKRGAPPNDKRYAVQPSHMVIVRGTLRGLEGGDHIALNPIVGHSSDYGFRRWVYRSRRLHTVLGITRYVRRKDAKT